MEFVINSIVFLFGGVVVLGFLFTGWAFLMEMWHKIDGKSGPVQLISWYKSKPEIYGKSERDRHQLPDEDDI